MAIKTYQAFTPPSPYEQERRKAEQMRRYAELLQEQAMAEEEPYTFQGIRAMPSPAAALGKLLKAYGSKKAYEKADEAEARKAGMEQQASQQIMGRLTGAESLFGRDKEGNVTSVYEPIEKQRAQIDADIERQRASGQLEEMRPTAQYTRDPMYAARIATTGAGAGAMKGNPMLAAMLQRSMEAPASEEFYAPTETADGLVQFGKRGGRRDTGLKAPVKTPEPTTTQRDYDFAKSQGYTGSFEDFRRSSAPSTVVNLDTKGSALGQELYLKKIDQLSGPATSANRIVNQVSAMDEATKRGTFTGAMAPNAVGAAQFLSSFGIDVNPEVLANTRAFQAASNQLVLDFMASNGGARGFTEKETAILQDAFPKIVDSPQARQKIASLLRNRAKKDVQDYNQAVETYKKTYPNSVIPYNKIEDANDRYEAWKRSQGIK
jgi:hypothetical protein